MPRQAGGCTNSCLVPPVGVAFGVFVAWSAAEDDGWAMGLLTLVGAVPLGYVLALVLAATTDRAIGVVRACWTRVVRVFRPRR